MVCLDDITRFRSLIREQALAPKFYWEQERGQLSHLPLHKNQQGLHDDIIAGLDQAQKMIAPRWFYDAEGSRLFERICEQPEYYLTRAETNLLELNAPRIADDLGETRTWIELGSGTSQKTRHLFAGWQQAATHCHYVPVDISRSALVAATPLLLAEFSELWVSAIHGPYEAAFKLLQERADDLPVSVLFLGSNIGNFSNEQRRQFFEDIATAIGSGSSFAFGADLVKDKSRLEAAYNDAAGVTAQFNKNVLVRLNRELNMDFNVDSFEHRAFFNEQENRIEMHLESLQRQEVHFGELSWQLEAGETIHTENSYKFEPAHLSAELEQCGFRVADRLQDEEGSFSFWIATLN